MSDLTKFLEADFKPTYKIVYLPRVFLEFKLRPLSSEEFEELQDQFLNQKKNNPHTKDSEIGYSIILASIVEPNLLDERILNKANVSNPEDFLKKFLLPGEVETLITSVKELLQFKKLSNQMVVDAKN